MHNKFLLLPLIVLLTSCGFHLRGYNNTDYKFPFNSVFVKCQNVVICSNLETMIKTHDLAIIESQEDKAEAVILLYNEQTSRDIQSFNAAGRISAYLMTYQVQAKVFEHNVQLGNQINVSVNGTLQYNDATILSNNQGEADLWNTLHNNATNQLVRKIIFSNSFRKINNESK